ncbi:DedA family protein [Actinoallomurus spadix]|uniref:DedA family protein n=1 Tax=Actinoallomurus spadix TaxID=79912 RepID=A0ABN0X9E4_9ACTN|nr:DedA family protein [Actinoallomurus spadix]MCO5987942.1 DedA family protein [Actinoallomurus spadix]
MALAVNLLDPHSLIATFGLVGILAVIFAETGLLIGFFLPGDTLLVTAGVFSTTSAATANHISPLPLPALLIGAPLCAIAGAQVGHFLGAKYGRKLFDRPDSRLFRQDHVEKAEHYFNKFGPAKAVVLARFAPVVRTFLNPLAGMLEMSASRFFVFNTIGAVLWTETIILLGRFLGDRVKGIDKYILPVVAVAVLISVIPVIREIIRGPKKPGQGGDGRKTAMPSGRHRR